MLLGVLFPTTAVFYQHHHQQHQHVLYQHHCQHHVFLLSTSSTCLCCWRVVMDWYGVWHCIIVVDDGVSMSARVPLLHLSLSWCRFAFCLVCVPAVIAAVVAIVSLPDLREIILIENKYVILLLINKDSWEKYDKLDCHCNWSNGWNQSKHNIARYIYIYIYILINLSCCW